MKTGRTRQVVETNVEAADRAEEIAAILQGIETMLVNHPDGLDVKLTKRAGKGPRLHVRVGFVDATYEEIAAAEQSIQQAFPFIYDPDDDQQTLDLDGAGKDEDDEDDEDENEADTVEMSAAERCALKSRLSGRAVGEDAPHAVEEG